VRETNFVIVEGKGPLSLEFVASMTASFVQFAKQSARIYLNLPNVYLEIANRKKGLRPSLEIAEYCTKDIMTMGTRIQ
jgi:hypothetical protein